jgi:hypothetical protein
MPPMRRGEGAAPAMTDEAASGAKPTAETGSGRPDARSAQRGGGGAGRPRPERGPATLAGPSMGGGGREGGRRSEPRTVTIERVDVPGGAFADNWFAPPSKPVRMAPPPPRGDGPPPRPRGDE